MSINELNDNDIYNISGEKRGIIACLYCGNTWTIENKWYKPWQHKFDADKKRLCMSALWEKLWS